MMINRSKTLAVEPLLITRSRTLAFDKASSKRREIPLKLGSNLHQSQAGSLTGESMLISSEEKIDSDAQSDQISIKKFRQRLGEVLISPSK